MNGLGLLHAEAGRETDAVAAFEQATALIPSNAAYSTNLGNARRASGNLGRAEAAYRRALKGDATYADAANGLGTILVQTGKPADAVQWFERAIQQTPDFHEARLNLGMARRKAVSARAPTRSTARSLPTHPARFKREREAAAQLLAQKK